MALNDVFTEQLKTRLQMIGCTDITISADPLPMKYRATLRMSDGRRVSGTDWSPLAALEKAYAAGMAGESDDDPKPVS